MGEIVAKDENESDVVSANNSRRSVRRKMAKEELQKKKDGDKKISLATESVSAQLERNVALKRHYDIMLFTSAPTSCDPSEYVKYFRTMRESALAEILN